MNEAELNAYLAAIVDSSDDAILSKNLDGIIQSFNAAAERLFGYSAAEIVGRSILTLIPEGRKDEEKEILSRLRRGERIEHFETVRQRKDGTLVDVSLSVSPVRNARGEVVGAAKIARDIGARKRNAESSARLAAIVESTDDAIISKDLEGTIRSFNPAAERMFGWTAEEAVGRPVTILIPPDRQDEEEAILARLRRGERLEHFETVRVTKDGRMLDISLTISPLRDEAGRIVGASKVARDVTERKRLNAELARHQEWFRITLNSIGDAVIASDRDGRVTFLNHEAERLTGWTSAEAAGRFLDEVFRLVHEQTGETLDSPADRVLRSRQAAALSNHAVLVARDRRQWPIADSAAPIVDPGGEVLGVVLVFREITEAKRAEESRRAASAERERLLQSERAARSEAETANRVKDDFVAMVSHELRTPLNAILGWTELLRRDTTDAANVARGIEVIARNTRLQAQLIMDLLDVSRIVSGKLRLEMERTDLGPLVRASIDTLSPEAKDRGVAIVSRIGDTPIPLLGDPARLHQIVWNLLSNAIKFTPRDGTVTVAAEADGPRARLTVSDTGAGIRAEVLPEIFERFRQGGGVTTRRHGGLGLGLSITRHLVELHGGSIEARSEGEGRGATFVVDLPLAEVAPPAAAGPDARDTRAAGVSLHGLRLLLVEDDLDTRDLLRRLLEAHRAEVAVAASAPEALEHLALSPPDILVSDIGLPDVDGYELIRRVRQLDGLVARVPAIALTAFARPDDRANALRSGYNAHLSKPVEPNDLVITVGSFRSLVTANRAG